MNKEAIETIAQACHNMNLQVCLLSGDESQLLWDDAPQWQRDSAVDGVWAIARLEIDRPYQSHEVWAAHKRAAGWVYGEVKDADKKTHPCLVPFCALPPHQQLKDHVFFQVATHMLMDVYRDMSGGGASDGS